MIRKLDRATMLIEMGCLHAAIRLATDTVTGIRWLEALPRSKDAANAEG